jgi:hypothetical protein
MQDIGGQHCLRMELVFTNFVMLADELEYLCHKV